MQGEFQSTEMTISIKRIIRIILKGSFAIFLLYLMVKQVKIIDMEYIFWTIGQKNSVWTIGFLKYYGYNTYFAEKSSS